MAQNTNETVSFRCWLHAAVLDLLREVGYDALTVTPPPRSQGGGVTSLNDPTGSTPSSAAGPFAAHGSSESMIGFSLAIAVFFDAFVVRMAIVPAVLALLGRRAWWLPPWLDRALPNVDVEGEGLRKQLAGDAGAAADGGREPTQV